MLLVHTGGCTHLVLVVHGGGGDVQYASGAGGAHRGMYSRQVVLVGHTGMFSTQVVPVVHTEGCSVHKWCWWSHRGMYSTQVVLVGHTGMFSTQVVPVVHTEGCSVHKWCWWGTQGDVQYTSGAGGAHRGM